MSLNEVISDLKALLEYERDEGAQGVSVSPEVLAAVGAGSGGYAHGNSVARSVPPQTFVPAQPDRSASPQTPVEDDSLVRIAAEVTACTLCPLHGTRTNAVPGQGSPTPDIVFVGEGPGADEDEQGLAFVGRAGQLLTRMIEAMGLTREDVFICNVVKCRPPANRTPELSEMIACLPYLKRQIALLNPKVIVAMGATALTGLVELPKGMGITRARGTWMRFSGIDLMPTFHPAYLLRNPNMKKYVWEDLQTVLRHLDMPIPEIKKR